MSARPAVPDYISKVAGSFDTCAPGHRFALYCPVWDAGWKLPAGQKQKAIEAATKVPHAVGKLLEQLRERQRALAAQDAENWYLQAAIATSPFATGLGNEHPVENGFAFLSPYGLPYLPGTGVKGVLRRAAEELALGGGFTGPAGELVDLLDVWWLFGFESEGGLLDLDQVPTPDQAAWREALGAALRRLRGRADLDTFIARIAAGLWQQADKGAAREQFFQMLGDRAARRALTLRGALSTWDVFPAPERSASTLAVEVMTPHHTHYYRDGNTPHDAGQPNPIPFLAVPAGWRFDFHVTCAVERLPEPVRGRWRALLDAIFEQAFDALGFGAKTAVGYGQMRPDETAREAIEGESRRLAEQEAREREARGRLEKLPEDERWLVMREAEGAFSSNDRLLDALQPWLDERESISDGAWKRLEALLEKTWPGILRDPDATRGKKQVPSFKPRPRALARRLLALRTDR